MATGKVQLVSVPPEGVPMFVFSRLAVVRMADVARTRLPVPVVAPTLMILPVVPLKTATSPSTDTLGPVTSPEPLAVAFKVLPAIERPVPRMISSMAVPDGLLPRSLEVALAAWILP